MKKQSLVVDGQPRLSQIAMRVRPDHWIPVKARRYLTGWLEGIHLSIRAKILLTLGVVIMMLGMTNAVLILQVWNFSQKYDAMINNITTANSMNGTIKPAIDTEMWNIVAGKTEFAQGKQYEIIEGVNSKLQWMSDHAASTESLIKLEVINRTMKTLTHYVDVMGEQIASGSTVGENESVLENIRGVSLCGGGGRSGLPAVRSEPSGRTISRHEPKLYPVGGVFAGAPGGCHGFLRGCSLGYIQ
jgi:hypothetical protein